MTALKSEMENPVYRGECAPKNEPDPGHYPYPADAVYRMTAVRRTENDDGTMGPLETKTLIAVARRPHHARLYFFEKFGRQWDAVAFNTLEELQAFQQCRPPVEDVPGDEGADWGGKKLWWVEDQSSRRLQRIFRCSSEFVLHDHLQSLGLDKPIEIPESVIDSVVREMELVQRGDADYELFVFDPEPKACPKKIKPH